MLQIMKNNRAIVCGTLADEPEFKNIGSKNTPIVNFSVLAERGNRDAGESSTFCRCVAFGRLIDVLRTCEKGDPVFALCTTRQREYNGKTYTDYTAEFVTAAIPGGKAAMSSANGAAESSGFPGTQVEDDDLPF